MKKAKLTFCLILLLTLFASFAYAGWQEGQTVVTGSFGKDVGQFGFVNASPEDGFPRLFLVDDNNNIIIADSLNLRVVIYKSNGDINAFSYKNINVDWPITQWPTQNFGVVGKYIFEGGVENFQFYDYQGNLVNQFYIPKTVFKSASRDGNIIIQNYEKGKFYKYSPLGELIKSYSAKPLEFGVINTSPKQNDGKYKTVIKFEDVTYSIVAKIPIDEFGLDQNGNLMAPARVGVGGKTVKRIYKFDKCGKQLGSLDLPDDNIVVIEGNPPPGIPPRPTPKMQYIAEYGKPVIGPNGDIYTWKRTPDTYSILKWTWVDDPNDPKGGPNAPEEFKVLPSISGIYLTWKTASQDPGCVSGYEVERATSSGGIFSKVADVGTGVFKYHDETVAVGTTYYYRVRAMSDIGASDYTVEGSAKR